MRVLLRIVAVIVITGVVVLLVARGQEFWLVAGLVAGVVVAAVVGRRQRHLEEAEEPTGEFDQPGEFDQVDEIYGEPYAEPGDAAQVYGQPGEPGVAYADYPADAPEAEYADAPAEPLPGEAVPDPPVREAPAGWEEPEAAREPETGPEPDDGPAPEAETEPGETTRRDDQAP